MTPTPEYRTISLTRGLVALVDAADYEWLTRHKWYAVHCWADKFYAGRRNCGTKLYMHRAILDASPDMYVDHVNGDTLDNRRANIRMATHSENQYNRGTQANNTSGYKGVALSVDNRPGRRNRWVAQIKANGKSVYIGSFATAEAAYAAYCEAAMQYHGEFSYAGNQASKPVATPLGTPGRKP
jgi:hypothetical protein